MSKVIQFFRLIRQPDVFMTFLNYTIKIFLGPIIILFVPLYLNGDVQGYWYTFGSIAALTTFADLGFTTIMTQFAAHEFTYLKLDSDLKIFVGDEEKIERISSLFQFVIRWITKVVCLATVIIFVAGIIMFSGKSDGVLWFPQWILFVFGTIVDFVSQIELSFFEGCNQFAITQKIKTISGCIHCIVTILLLAMGFGLFALGIPLLVKTMAVYLMSRKSFGASISQMIKCPVRTKVNWKTDFVPLLGKYAISWISGYFAMQIYNPLAFSKYGAVTAGRVGYCLSIVNAIYSVANVWNFLAVPKYNMQVEEKKWREMDHTLKGNLIYSLGTYILGGTVLLVAMCIPALQGILVHRLLSFGAIITLLTAYIFSIIIYALAIYLRAHKQEPFMVVSVSSGFLSSILTFFLIQILGVEYIFAGMLVTNIIITPIGIMVWNRCRKIWHFNEREII